MSINRKSIYHTKNLDHDYFEKQIVNPYESTIQFFKFLNKYKPLKNKKIIDLACGSGANLIYLKENFKVQRCWGFDQNNYLIKNAKKYAKHRNIKNLNFIRQDVEDLNFKKSKDLTPDGVISIQTLSILNDYEKIIRFAKNLKPNFICINSLFWEGDIDFKIAVNFLKKNKRSIVKINHYNIYSIKHYIKFLKKLGYPKIFLKKFKTNKKLKTKNKNLMGSYSIDLNHRSVIKSGPLILDWFFILATK